MDWDVVERLIGLVERSRVTELDYAVGAMRLRILRDAGSMAEPDAAPLPRGDRPAPGDAAGHPAGAPSPSPHILCAGLPGTFFRSPAPGQPPFVAEGDAVEEGRTLAILEAMKMLNPVEADRAGRIAQILVADGASVEAGTPLFLLAPAT